jgi:SAM-dependent methyltransferase
MDFVYSAHLLEHVQDFESALREWWRVIKPGGYLVLYLPHKKFYPNIGTPGSNPDHVHDFTPEEIEKAMRAVGFWDLVRNEDRNENTEYSFFRVYKKHARGKPEHRHSYRHMQPAKRAAVLRYGAYGDLLQAASLFPGVKTQGYHVTLYTTPRGAEVVKHDPHIDEIYIQDRDQVPNHLLGDFWDWESKKYVKFINLSEAVEGQWLALPGRINHRWPINLRKKYMNGNYLEFAHDMADVPVPPRQRFYPTQDERAWAARTRKAIGGDKFILYSLSGSAVHKVWLWMDQLFARLLMTYPDCRIVTGYPPP